jgi:cell division protein FtsB
LRFSEARTGYRQEQDAYLHRLETENKQLKAENEALRKKIEELARNS